MEILQSLFIGAVQGVTEFLPVSSTAHLILIPKFFGWPDLGLKWDTALHFGTLLAILIFFAKDWIEIVKSGVGSLQFGAKKTILQPSTLNPQPSTSYPANILWQIIIASIPAAIAGYLIQDKVESALYKPVVIVFTLAIFGILFLIIDKLVGHRGEIKQVRWGQSFAVGIAQMLALVPGVSRSGITMIASRMIGLNREDAARFSFLLSTPAVLGAFGLQALKLTGSDITSGFVLSVIASAVFGYLAIKYLLKFLQRNDFTVFAVYRIILAMVVWMVLI